MCILSPEIEHLVLDKIRGSLKNNIGNCEIYELVKLVLICKSFKMHFNPILQEINASPIGWAIQHEHRQVFEYWFEIVKIWVSGCNSKYFGVGVGVGVVCEEYAQKLKGNIEVRRNAVKDGDCEGDRLKCSDLYDQFSRYVFSLAGKHDVSSGFLKYLWMLLHKNGFSRFSLEEYFAACKKKPVKDREFFRTDLLRDSSALNVLYHIEMNYMCGPVSS